ncbi:MAG: formate dehydrogenase accessory sulfurtransferase FdhD [Hyphomicrobiaceae bacterium]
MSVMSQAIKKVQAHRLHLGEERGTSRVVPEEVPVAFVYNGATAAVMMASPIDLEDFAVGFSLTEGHLECASNIEELEIVPHDGGIELRMWLASHAGQRLASRRRAMLGPTGCGLCGIESIAAALPVVPAIRSDVTVAPAKLIRAMTELRDLQVLNAQASALHAAAFYVQGRGIISVREDVGRHNALDKLAGAIAREEINASEGVALLTSRVSVEMVQKAASCGIPVVAAVSAPTALAIKTAHAAGITMAAIVRHDGFEVFTHPHRIVDTCCNNSALENKNENDHAGI